MREGDRCLLEFDLFDFFDPAERAAMIAEYRDPGPTNG
jgi:hypothetical protein